MNINILFFTLDDEGDSDYYQKKDSGLEMEEREEAADNDRKLEGNN